MSSVKLNLKSRSKGKITRWSSTREISSELSWSREMKNWRFFMRRSRFRNQLLRRERFTIKKRYMIFLILERKFLGLRESLLHLNVRLHVFQISREKSIFCRRSILSNSRKPSIFLMSLLSLWTSTDGESLNALIQRLMKWFKRFSHSKRGSLPKLRKSQRRMCLSKKKRSSTSSWRTSWPSKVVQRLQRNSKFINKT